MTVNRFSYRPAPLDPEFPEEGVYEDEWEVLVKGEVVGTVQRRHGVSDTYWGAWKSGRDLYETRRAAAEGAYRSFLARQEAEASK